MTEQLPAVVPSPGMLAALQADITRGLVDLAQGRVKDFNAARIIERGRKLLASRSRSV